MDALYLGEQAEVVALERSILLSSLRVPHWRVEESHHTYERVTAQHILDQSAHLTGVVLYVVWHTRAHSMSYGIL